MKRRMKREYLFVFNITSCIGWIFVLSNCLLYIPNPRNPDFKEFENHVSTPLKYVQTLAILEFIHSLTSLVRAHPFTTFLQVISRIVILWGVLHGMCVCVFYFVT